MSVHITCDACAKDLSDSGPRPAFFATLKVDRQPTTSDSMYALAVKPSLPRGEHHFCGKQCLLDWIENKG